MIHRVNSISDQDFLHRYALKKEVCILGSNFTANWPVMRDWIAADGQSINVEVLNKQYGKIFTKY